MKTKNIKLLACIILSLILFTYASINNMAQHYTASHFVACPIFIVSIIYPLITALIILLISSYQLSILDNLILIVIYAAGIVISFMNHAGHISVYGLTVLFFIILKGLFHRK